MQSLRLNAFRVEEISFKLNKDAVAAGTRFKVFPKLNITLNNAEKSLFLIMTTVIDKNQETPPPFELTATISGSFTIIADADLELRKAESATILYPYLRALVSTVTANANVPPYQLPLIDFYSVPGMKNYGQQQSRESIIIRPLEDI